MIRADSPDRAYERALELGEAGSTEYLNPDGKLVTIRFKGLSFMDVIHDPLEDGAELTFSSEVGVASEELDALVRPREKLALFSPSKPLNGPDVASAEVIELVEEQFGLCRPIRE